jgi:hypothetical protein
LSSILGAWNVSKLFGCSGAYYEYESLAAKKVEWNGGGGGGDGGSNSTVKRQRVKRSASSAVSVE